VVGGVIVFLGAGGFGVSGEFVTSTATVLLSELDERRLRSPVAADLGVDAACFGFASSFAPRGSLSRSRFGSVISSAVACNTVQAVCGIGWLAEG
jgi:hypothetical protein